MPGPPSDDPFDKTMDGVLLSPGFLSVPPPPPRPAAKPPAPPPPLDDSSDDPPPAARSRSGVSVFRPTARPGMAVLTVFDDGTVDGETIRLRGDRFVIGRTTGDLLIPHDPAVAPTHAVITRPPGDGRGAWEVADAGSDTGLFIRVSRAKLTNGKEFLIGRGRYRFETAGGPEVVEVTAAGDGIRLPLTGPEHWIGTDPGCDLWRPDDPYAEPRHARVARDPDGAWAVAHNKTLNGLWLRVTEVAVNGTCLFQIGEQRFKLRAPV